MFLFTIENFHDRLKTERLYLSYRKLMYKEAFEIVQNRHCAEDAVSESFVRIIDNLHKIDEQDCLKTRSFLVIICQNVAKNIYNKKIYLNNQPDAYEDVLPKSLKKLSDSRLRLTENPRIYPKKAHIRSTSDHKTNSETKTLRLSRNAPRR